MLYLFFIVRTHYNIIFVKFVQIGWLPGTTKQNKNRPQNAGSCVCESLEFQNFPGGMPPDPPRKGDLPKQYPPVMLNYLLVPKFIETPVNRKESVFFSDSLLQTGLTESFSLCWLSCQLSFLLFCEVSEVRAIVCKDRRNKNEANCLYEEGSTNITATSNIQRLRNRHRKTILLQYLALIHAVRDDIPQNLE